jgi:hypothetical protein
MNSLLGIFTTADGDKGEKASGAATSTTSSYEEEAPDMQYIPADF